MGGGLLQLVAFGSQDVYLTGSPQITYFKVIFKRYTQYAIESVSQSWMGQTRYGAKTTAVISRNGDLLGDMYLEAKMTRGTTGTTYYPGENLLKSVVVELGGQQLDKLSATWYRIYDNLYRTPAERLAYRKMVDFMDGESAGTSKRMFIPILFWWCRSPGSYIPLLSLQYHELRITFEFEDVANIPGIHTDTATYPLTADLWCDYVFLDVAERKKFAEQSHEYVIEQVQFTGDENVIVAAGSQKSQQVRLNFNHPTKLLAWAVCHPTIHGKVTANGPGPGLGFVAGMSGSATNTNVESFAPLATAKLMLNGHDRAAPRSGAYFNKVVPYQAAKVAPDAGIYYMSFALSPTQHAPSGSLNMSRIDSAVLALTFKDASKVGLLGDVANVKDETFTVTDAQTLSSLRVYAVNYNILRVLSGMGGLAFSN